MASTTVKVRITPERLAEMEAQVQDALGSGDWHLRLSAPEVAVLLAAYRGWEQSFLTACRTGF